ncbi:hypothetical protein CEUSTIGMA_g145.t1 [Chlamydomonas eustigma]|uniref:Patatin n=1 Tax=Chlamydomonas eustigma TaxID=1157962 RepID=A0A250WPR5_9CHLO|nr:hypothetical protein CEUSTIGMA_g145.t1 [Chlamydomonas eustigma]|eukprot:GAX72689.1 hypothetical protein CEUSTIGMA_g145.t1 [Chlamydomonas eustigma]
MRELKGSCIHQRLSPCYGRSSNLSRRCSKFSARQRLNMRTKLYMPHTLSALVSADSLPNDRIRTALKEGTLGFGFSAGGFLFNYHLGVLWELEELGLLKGHVPLAGASAGSLAIATYQSGVGPETASRALKELAVECRKGGTMGRLSGLLRAILNQYLPSDAHERCSGVCHIAVTRLFPYMQREIISHFDTKSDLIDALITSCHIPVYANGSWMIKFRDRYYMDGGVMDFVPSPPETQHVVKVCCFPVHQVLNAVQPSIQGLPRLSSLLDISLSPDKFEPFHQDFATLFNWAMLPAPDHVLEWLVEKGRRDASAWAAAVDSKGVIA